MMAKCGTGVKRTHVYGHTCKEPRLCVLCSSVVLFPKAKAYRTKKSFLKRDKTKLPLFKLAKVLLFIPAFIGIGASRADSPSYSIQCMFDSVKNTDGDFRKPFFQSYKFEIDKKEVIVIDDMHQSLAEKVYGFNNITLLEQTAFGSMVTTTIVFKKEGQQMEAVQSRHETLNHHVMPFQTIGYCDYA